MSRRVVTKTPIHRLDPGSKFKLSKIQWHLRDERDAAAAIEAKRVELGWQEPVSVLTGSSDGKGYFRVFPHDALIMWRRDGGAHAVYGSIGKKWDDYGGVSGRLGWPITDETSTPAGTARYNHFEHGSIYWSGSTGAHVIYGAIRDLWASLGWEKGALGLPTSDEINVPETDGPRRNTFECGEITWTPWSGAAVTRLYGVDPEEPPHRVVLQNLGGDSVEVPAPQVKRHLVISAYMKVTDDEYFDNEHGKVERRSETWLDSWDPQGVMTLIGKAGGEVRVELEAIAVPRPDGSVRVTIELKLYEGTSEESSDLDGSKTKVIVVPPDQILQTPLRVHNDDEGGDFADISLVLSNFAV